MSRCHTGTTYDAASRVTSETDALDGVTTYTYDAAGNRLTATNPEGTTRYRYDAQNRLIEEIQPNGSVLSYGYDAAGNRTQLDVSAGGSTTTTSYSFDALNRLEVVEDNQGQTIYTYDAVGNRTSVSYPSGNVTLYDYDALNRLTRLTTTDAADQIVADYAYTLDATGRRTQVQETHSGRTTAYTYDELYRLTTETITDPVNGDYTAEYQFDKVGNRTYSIINGVHTAYSVDNNDRLTQQGGVSYSYDANGNTLTETEDGQETRYHYDARNKLIEVAKPGLTASYGYNADGIRTRKTENGQTTNYVVDSNRDYAQVLAEVTNGITEMSYTYGDDLVSQTRAGTPSYYLYDGHGSTRALADAGGSLTDSYDYDAFGVLLASSGDTENDYLYAGEQLDQNLDQYYLRARYYNQQVGRFTQQDTWMGFNHDPMTLHKYLYANADPITYTDPTGMFSMASLGASFRVHSATAGQAVANYSRIYSRMLWGEVKEFVKDELTEQAFGLLGDQIVGKMVQAVQNAPILDRDGPQAAGSKAHRALKDLIRKHADEISEMLSRHGADVSIEAELYFGKHREPTRERAKGSMGLDVTVTNNNTGKVLLGFNLKTGKTGTSRAKGREYVRRNRGAPFIDVFVKRTK